MRGCGRQPAVLHLRGDLRPEQKFTTCSNKRQPPRACHCDGAMQPAPCPDRRTRAHADADREQLRAAEQRIHPRRVGALAENARTPRATLRPPRALSLTRAAVPQASPGARSPCKHARPLCQVHLSCVASGSRSEHAPGHRRRSCRNTACRHRGAPAARCEAVVARGWRAC